MSKKLRKERAKRYAELFEKNPFHADDFKRFIYNDKKEKDICYIIRDVESIRRALKRIANESGDFIQEEMDDLRYFIKSQIGKKNFKKLSKVFSHK